jgi:hypothetical protein
VNTPPKNELPQRHNPAADVHIQLGQSNIVLLTIATQRREPWLGNETVHQFLRQTWSEATAWLVGDYLLMPDHLHLFCAPRDLHFTIEKWIAYWKREFSLKHGRRNGSSNRAAGIIGYATARIIPRSGFTFRKIHSVKDWCAD